MWGLWGLGEVGCPEEVPGGVAPGRLGRAFSPRGVGGAGTQGFALGWARTRLWRWMDRRLLAVGSGLQAVVG